MGTGTCNTCEAPTPSAATVTFVSRRIFFRTPFENCVPEFIILDECEGYQEAIKLERDYISKFGRVGLDEGGTLANIASGLGHYPQDISDMRSAMRAATIVNNARVWKDAERRAARVISMQGKKKTATDAAMNARIKNLALARTPEARAAISAELLERWERPGYREMRSRNQIAAWTDGEKRANMLEGRSEGIAQSWEDPAVRAARSSGISAAMADKLANDPDYVARLDAGRVAAWADPHKKAARVAKMLETRRRNAAERGVPVEPTAAATANRSAAMKVVNAEFTAEDRSVAQKDSWADPDIAARRRAGLTAAAQDPELKAARIANMLAGKRRKAAEKAAAASRAELPVEHE